MVRDINGFSNPQVGASQNRNKTAETGKNAPELSTPAQHAVAKSAQDTVHISAQARALSQLETRLAQLPDVNSRRVAELKEAIEKGQYRIDDEGIADKMLNEDKEFS